MTDGKVTSKIFIILRVFDLDRDAIDMHLYVDPKGAEKRGRLVFVPESYSVSMSLVPFGGFHK